MVGIVLHVLGGYLLWMVNLLGFVSVPAPNAKWVFIAAVAVLAVVPVGGGLALRGFQNWRRDVGIVLLCVSGFTAFAAFSVFCMLLSEEVRTLVRPDTIAFMSDYVTGGAVTLVFAGLGWMLLSARGSSVESPRSRSSA